MAHVMFEDLAIRLAEIGVMAKVFPDHMSAHVKSGEPDQSGASLVVAEGFLPNFCGPIGPLAWEVLDVVKEWSKEGDPQCPTR